MAIWQYQIYIVPEEEVDSYFKNENSISYDDLSEIKWWKYRQLKIDSFNTFIKLLPRKDSWSREIILFGDESSNCIEVLLEENLIIEISIRVDLRLDYKGFINLLCEYALSNKCMFLNDKLEILYPNLKLLENDIMNYPRYKAFLDKLGE